MENIVSQMATVNTQNKEYWFQQETRHEQGYKGIQSKGRGTYYFQNYLERVRNFPSLPKYHI